MTAREHFEAWMKNRFPNMPLDHGEAEDFYYHDIVQFMWQAWQEAPLHRPTTNTKITKEQLRAMKEDDDPATIVARLNGWYGSAVGPYPVPNVQKEAAREIERLREDAARYRWLVCQDVDDHIFIVSGKNGMWGECGHSDFGGLKSLIDEVVDIRMKEGLNKNPASAGF